MVDLTLRGQYREALQRATTGDPMAALAICRRILETFPRHVATYGVLGRIYLELGDHRTAADLFRRLLSADPEHVLAYVGLAIILEEQGRPEEALWQWERAFELSPGNPEIRKELYRLRGGGRNLPSRLKPNRAALARAYMRGQLYQKAAGELQVILRRHPRRYDLQAALAESLWHSERLGAAEEICINLLTELPFCLKANLILGQIWLNTEHDARARALLQRAQTLDPENAMARRVLGARSSLPPRIVRLPLRADDMPPLDLPYLQMDDEGKDDDRVIEGARVSAVPLKRPVPQLGAGPSHVSTPVRDKLPSLQARIQYVKRHPDDPVGRLALARRYRDIGMLNRALEHYNCLLRRNALLEDVARDMESWCRLHPTDEAARALWQRARKSEASR
ncbi:MAG: tetratricopeptide repeat protein [Anaerolineae bacterium]|jgi:tetratricopeptide (TPR) repeat protein